MYSKCNHHTKDLCTDEIGKLQVIAKREDGSLPSSVRREWAKFGRENWAIRSYIEANSVKLDPTTQSRVFDIHRQQQLVVRCLLREWSLGEYDPELVIKHCEMPNLPFTMIQDEQFKRITEVDGDVIKAFIEGYIRKTKDL
jgi:hypothetical protein